ncbi:MAG: hypothetical protein B6D55_01815 [Candidatus Omnitrophica bacterium 4484_70.2]|nr:MAG: hypothetical protein B6D55_01815 [Candidatus Omnitrophica bacterium 4484_70.2]
MFFLIKLYRSVSFYFPSCCKFYPSCSEYVEEAFLKYPFRKALRISLFRLLRCNIFSRGGIDPL